MSSFTCERRTAEPDLETGHEAGALTMLAGFACPAVVPLTGHDSGAPVGGLGPDVEAVASAPGPAAVANEADADVTVTVTSGRPGLRAPDAVMAPPAVPPAAAGLPPTCLTFPARGATGRVVPVGVLPRGELQLPDHLGTGGWWDGGATIGALHGSVVLAGHVDSEHDRVGSSPSSTYSPSATRSWWTTHSAAATSTG